MILRNLLKSCRLLSTSCSKFSHGGYPASEDIFFLAGKLKTAGDFYITRKKFLQLLLNKDEQTTWLLNWIFAMAFSEGTVD